MFIGKIVAGSRTSSLVVLNRAAMRTRALEVLVIFALCGCFFASSSLHAQERIALIVANENYPDAVRPLVHAHEDGDNIAKALTDAGFIDAIENEDARVIAKYDLNKTEFKTVFDSFLSRLENSPGAIGFFYYSGHGGSAAPRGVRTNYIIPTEAHVTRQRDLLDHGIEVETLIKKLSLINTSAAFAVFDSCRNNLPIGSKGSEDRGWAPISPSKGLLVAYATADGETTPDDGLYSQKLAEEIKRQGQHAVFAFTAAAQQTSKFRFGSSIPYFSAGYVPEDICFMSCSAASASAPVKSSAAVAVDQQVFDRLRTSRHFEAFLDIFPESKLAAKAREWLQKLKDGSLVAEASQLFRARLDPRTKGITAVVPLEDWPVGFTYMEPGYVSGANSESSAEVLFPDLVFPVQGAPSFVNAQFKSPGTSSNFQPATDQCDPDNYSYPWRDNFCEEFPQSNNMFCKSGRGHRGVDIRAGTPELCREQLSLPRSKRKVAPIVAVSDGYITNIGRYSVMLQAEDGTMFSYSHLNTDALEVSPGQKVEAGDLIGYLSDHMISREGENVPTTLHLHFEAMASVTFSEEDGPVLTHVPTYSSLVKAYERLVGTGANLGKGN